MNCPACTDQSLSPVLCAGQEVDVCRRCGGIWFDKDELLSVVKRLISENKVDPQTMLHSYRGKPVSTEKIKELQRICPRCHLVMELRNYSYDSNVIINLCPSCDGIWTDAGEMRAVAKYIKGSPEMYGFAKSLVEISDSCRKTGSKTGRVIASIVVLIYLCIAYSTMGAEGAIRMLGALFLPYAFILYGEELGGLTGVRMRPSLLTPEITKPSPVGLVVFLGWIWLILVPIAGFAILTWGV